MTRTPPTHVFTSSAKPASHKSALTDAPDTYKFTLETRAIDKVYLIALPVTTMDAQKRTELQDNILNLASNCPMEHCNPADCPLYNVRKMELPGRLEWLNALSDEDLIYLNSYHFVCTKTKLDSLKAGVGK